MMKHKHPRNNNSQVEQLPKRFKTKKLFKSNLRKRERSVIRERRLQRRRKVLEKMLALHRKHHK